METGLLHSEKSVTLPKTTEAFQDYGELSPWLQTVISHVNVTFLRNEGICSASFKHRPPAAAIGSM